MHMSVDIVYFDFFLHKLRSVGITVNICIWLFYFVTDAYNFVRLPRELLKTTCVNRLLGKPAMLDGWRCSS